MIVRTETGSEVIINTDSRSTDIWLQLFVSKGNLGLALTPQEAMEAGLALWHAGRKATRPRVEIEPPK